MKDGTPQFYGNVGSVPMDVSRNHLALHHLGDGKWSIKNLNERNVTFVNGIAVESKTITEKDKVELGNSHYLLPWAALSEPKVETADIRPLRLVWNDYNEASKDIRIKQKNTNLLSSIPIAISMLGGLLSSFASDELRPYAYVFTAVALLVMLYGFYLRVTDNSIEEQEELKKAFQRRYVCPKCGHFMGFQDYDLLTQNSACPYCKTKYKK